MFYKIGITSRGVEDGYCHDGSNPGKKFPYYYEIVWTTQGDPGKIFDMENEYKKKTTKIRYQPSNWPAKTSRETFKCHGNCRILRKPIKMVAPNETTMVDLIG